MFVVGFLFLFCVLLVFVSLLVGGSGDFVSLMVVCECGCEEIVVESSKLYGSCDMVWCFCRRLVIVLRFV